MKKTGYLITYTTGQYEDICTYNVKVFLCKEKAEAYRDKWNRIYQKIHEFYKEEYFYHPDK